MTNILLFAFIILLCLILAACLFYLLANTITFARVKVPFVKAHPKAVDKILALANLRPGDIHFDLGAGNGQFIIKADKLYQASSTGFELSPWAYLACRFNLWKNKSSAKVKFKNFLAEDLSRAKVLTCFLLPGACATLRKKLERELAPGSTVISYAFALTDWQRQDIKEEIITSKDFPSIIYLYKTIGKK